MIVTMIISTLESTIGSDLYVNSIWDAGYLNDYPMKEFLEDQMAFDGAVVSYSFVTPNMIRALSGCDPFDNQQAGGTSFFNQDGTYISGVPANYLETINTKYFVPSTI